MRCRCVPDGGGRRKTEDFRGDPRSGAARKDLLVLVRRGRGDRVVIQGLRKKIVQIGQAAGRVCNERN